MILVISLCCKCNWCTTTFRKEQITGLASPQSVLVDGMPHYIRDLHPSPSSESSTSCEDVSKSEEEILVSMDRPDDPTAEEWHGDDEEGQ